ncbi:MAG: M48 family metallopeptidase, partial [Candidatus Delongbacteria bacterium]|nr:M48 family metallopeptidase [Candidatus Delongbacteria bacterium]
MEISVQPNCSVIVKVPLNTPLDAIEIKLKKRTKWILKQKKYFEQFVPRTPIKQFIGGESHLYLGKNYRLKIVS